MALAQDIQDVLDRHVPVQAVQHGTPKEVALVKEVQDLRAEIMDVVDILEDALKDLRKARARSP
jgi:hypothetical protein